MSNQESNTVNNFAVQMKSCFPAYAIDKIYEEVYLYGTYFNPASRHYGGTAIVVCDRCSKSNLDICIGFKEKDLCLQCVQEICNKRQGSPLPGRPWYTPTFPLEEEIGKPWIATPF